MMTSEFAKVADCPACAGEYGNHSQFCPLKDSQIRLAKVERALLKFVAVEQMFGHIGQHKASECADCARVLEAMDALGWRDNT